MLGGSNGEEGAAGTAAEVLANITGRQREFLLFLQRRVGSRQRAEDILQQSLLKALAQAKTVAKPASAAAWFYKVLRRTLLDEQRRLASEQRTLRAYGEQTDYVAPPAAASGPECGCLERGVGKLKPEYAEVLEYVHLSGLPLQQYSEVKKIGANNAAVRLSRARAALRRKLGDCCGACATGCEGCTCTHP